VVRAILPEEKEEFDIALAIECTSAFADSSEIGCMLSDLNGITIFEKGYCCTKCKLCSFLEREPSNCTSAHNYGMEEAERFGGKYIYFCPMGLTCFTSPIIGEYKSCAKITVGPFLMVEHDDFITYDLSSKYYLSPIKLAQVSKIMTDIPFVTPERVNALSVLLFLSVSFINNTSIANNFLKTQHNDAIQGQVNEYLQYLKNVDIPRYSIETERKFLYNIAISNVDEAKRLLTELLGHILYVTGGNNAEIKNRMRELLVLISRAAISGGGDIDLILKITGDLTHQMDFLNDFNEYFALLDEAVEQLTDSSLSFVGIKHKDVIFKAVQYIRRNYAQKITLHDVSSHVALSANYFSKIFKKEIGCSFNNYLNALRVEVSKQMLLSKQYRLADIATMVGFEDQSYYTKVFKKIVGIPPNKYKNSLGNMQERKTLIHDNETVKT